MPQEVVQFCVVSLGTTQNAAVFLPRPAQRQRPWAGAAAAADRTSIYTRICGRMTPRLIPRKHKTSKALGVVLPSATPSYCETKWKPPRSPTTLANRSLDSASEIEVRLRALGERLWRLREERCLDGREVNHLLQPHLAHKGQEAADPVEDLQREEDLRGGSSGGGGEKGFFNRNVRGSLSASQQDETAEEVVACCGGERAPRCTL